MNVFTHIFACFVTLLIASAAFAAAPPNIVFMLSDDQHWDEASIAMHPDSKHSFRDELSTPRLEQFASEGMRFSSAYAPAPVCSPTRISLMTGQSPAALHWTRAGPSLNASNNPKLIPPRSNRSIDASQTTFAKLLQQAGYRTAHLGKWHLSGGGPESHGFDVSDGNIGNEASAKYKAPNPVDLFGMAKRAEAFMAASKEQGKPFFIQLSWLALHSPENALPKTVEKYEQAGMRRGRPAQRAALTENMDTAVGRVLDSLDKLGLAENTFVIFMSDNGGNSRGGINGGKGNLYEGGIRVPLIIRGPGVAKDSWSHTPVIGYDLYPTFLEWAGVSNPPATVTDTIEGGSIAGLLNNKTQEVQRQRDGLVFHFPHYQTKVGPHSAIRLGDYKLIKFYETNEVELYNLKNDLTEKTNLAKKLPDQTHDLEERLDKALSELGAELPTANKQYDPSKPTEISSGPKKGKRR